MHTPARHQPPASGHRRRALCGLAFGALAAFCLAAGPESFDTLSKQYETQTRPLVTRFCLECHSTDEQQGELDLDRFATLADVRRAPRVWQKVAEMLDNGEMPPKKAAQPTDEQRKQLRGWVERYLNAEAHASAGDPGPVVLRRLNNAEYTYTLHDLTGVDLRPAREFPADSAAGEGFTNTGNSLVMSPALLTKYLDAAKEIADHAVLLPDGFRFASSTTRRDWTNETLADIREFYRQFTDSQGASRVNLQGIVFDTNDGGRLPLERYLAATLVERDALQAGRKTIESVAHERGLNAKYLGILWATLTGREPSLLLDWVRARWRAAPADGAVALAGEIGRWQQALWRFTSVGHIGKVGGPKAWQEPVTPLVARQEIRLKVPTAPDQNEVTLYLVATDAGDGNDNDLAVWERPRLVAPGRADLLLRDVRELTGELLARRRRLFAGAANCLSAAAEAIAAKEPLELTPLAKKHSVEPDVLAAWFEYLGVGGGAAVKIESHLTERITSSAGYEFVKGWGSPGTPNVAANSSDQHVRIPGNMKPHGVAMHPSPTLQIAAGWRSPVTATLRIEAKVQHAHPECGNGVAWSLELRRGNTRRRLAGGVAHGAKEIGVGPIDNLAVKPGDLVSLLIGPRDGNHACDLTAVDLTLTGDRRRWDLAADVSPDVLAGNPHADSLGNPDVWHFYTEPVSADVGVVVPADSVLAKWQAASDPQRRQRLATEFQRLLAEGPPDARDNPDAMLYRQVASLGGPLVRSSALRDRRDPDAADPNRASTAVGLDPALFRKHPSGEPIDPASLCVKAPAVIEVRLPADLVDGCELVTAGSLDVKSATEGSVQLQVLTTKPGVETGLVPASLSETHLAGPWTSDNRRVSHAAPVIVADGGAARQRFEAAFDAFRRVFPIALCYTKIVPVDEVVTLTLFHREDTALRRLMLTDAEAGRLDRLWDELHFVSHDAITLVDAFQQLLEYASQDADPKVFEPLRKPIYDRAAAFRESLVAAEPRHVAALLEFAARAYRRPLTEREQDELRGLYRSLRSQELPHDEAFRLTLARLFVAPAFLYRIEGTAHAANQASRANVGESNATGPRSAPVSDWELATRLSYFLWSSLPDAELREVAGAGKLHDPDVLVAQSRRMLKDPHTRRLATEFACQWLHIYEFNTLDEKSARHFPTFADLRDDMYEESIRFFTDLFQRDGSVLDALDADHTFLNESLAKHYAIAGVAGPEWRRVDGVRRYGRGGILGLAATLAQQSGASRTSPILRGNWVSEVLLGEKLPRPPKDVPRLPEDETATEGLTVRQLVEKHSSDDRCAKCHARIDPFGYALEGFDAIGRRRDKDLADRPIDARTRLPDGTELDGLGGLRNYLLSTRRDVFVRQFCRKLLGYSLGRGVQLSDGPLLDEMDRQLAKNGYHFSAAVETILRSRQFQHRRGAYEIADGGDEP